jgi:hypothetical protein
MGLGLSVWYTYIMATKIYDTKKISLVDDRIVVAAPLKIKYLREFLETFETIKQAKTDDESISILAQCALIAMQQYCPSIKTIEDLEDSLDLPTIYEVIDVAAGIKINEKSEDTVKDQAVDSGSTWDKLDLAKLESEVFLIGIWKDYDQLESSMSMQELTATLKIKRELDYSDKKFAAAMQGVDLDKNSGSGNEWEDMKARVFSKGATGDGNDILALQGMNAEKAGFGIGMGLDYEVYD